MGALRPLYFENMEKFVSAIQYIIETQFRDDLDIKGEGVVLGVDLETAQIIYQLSVLIGKLQVYYDKADKENFSLVETAFWNKFEEEGYFVDELEEWISFKQDSQPPQEENSIDCVNCD